MLSSSHLLLVVFQKIYLRIYCWGWGAEHHSGTYDVSIELGISCLRDSHTYSVCHLLGCTHLLLYLIIIGSKVSLLLTAEEGSSKRGKGLKGKQKLPLSHTVLDGLARIETKVSLIPKCTLNPRKLNKDLGPLMATGG